ncbi:acyl-CoA dehydrogenase family protein [Desulfothermus naphthae]
MQILPYKEEHHEFRKKLREYLKKEVIPHIDEWEKNKQVPKEAWKKLGRAGFLCPMVDKKYGGLGGDFLYSVILSEEFAYTNHSGLFAGLHSDIIVPYIVSFGTEEQKQKYLPGCVTGDIITAVAMTEPDAGSDLTSITTTATEEGDYVILNGTKTFISNGINCDLVIVAARDPEVEDPYKALSLYLVEDGTEGFKKGNKLDKMGLYSQDTAELFFVNCKIPKSNLLGKKHHGFLMLVEKLQQERLICSIGALAAAENVLNTTIEFAKNKMFNGKPYSRYQSVQFTLVELVTQIKMARTFLESLIVDHMEKKQVISDISMAKYWITDLFKNVADRCLDIYGEAGALESCPIDRSFRDARVFSIFAGTNEIMKKIIGKFMGL